jgi:stringent starvation protein B
MLQNVRYTKDTYPYLVNVIYHWLINNELEYTEYFQMKSISDGFSMNDESLSLMIRLTTL